MPSQQVIPPHIAPDADGTFDSHYYAKAAADALLAAKADTSYVDAQDATKQDVATLGTAVANTAPVKRVDPGVPGAVGQFLGFGPTGPTWRAEPHVDVTHPRFGGSIQAAETYAGNLAATSGADVVVWFPNGDYPITGSITKQAKTHWRGSGRIRRSDNANPSGAAFALVLAQNVADWSISGLTFENVSLETFQANGLTRTAGAGGENSGIDAIGCSSFAIEQCRFERFSYGIRHQDSHDYRIVDSIFRAMAHPSKTTQDYINEMTAGTYETSFPNTTSSATGAICVEYNAAGPSGGSYNYTIARNDIECFGLNTGIDGLSQTYNEQPGMIVNNTIYGCRCGIQSYRGSFTDPGTAPTFDARVLIAGNRISWAWEQGIYCRTSYGYLVDGNVLYRTGLFGLGGSGSSVGGIVTRIDPSMSSYTSPLGNPTPTMIVNNLLIDIGASDARCDGAIQVRLQNTIVRGNTITRTTIPTFVAGTSDFAITGTGGDTATNVVIADNWVSGHHNGIRYIQLLARSARRPHPSRVTWRIERNHIEQCGEYGITVEPYDIGGRIAGNTILQSATVGSGRAISVRSAPGCVIEANTIDGALTGIGLAKGNLASDIPYLLSAGAVTNARRRGGTLIVRNNVISNCTTPHGVSETTGNEGTFHGRCAVWAGDMVDGHPVTYTAAGGTPASTFTVHTWNVGDIVPSSNPASGATPAKVCTAAGTYGDTTASTGTTTSGSPVITAMSSLDGYGPGIYVTATGFSGARKIVAVDVVSGTITLDANASSSNAATTIGIAVPTFAAMANLV